MFRKKDDNELNVGRINELVKLAHNILQILMIFLIITGIYAVIIILKEVKALPFLLSVLKILSPLFIGIVIAWLFDPIVTYLNKKGVKRGLGAAICYIAFLGIIFIVIGSLIPVLSDQINDFVSSTIPSLFDSVKNWINSIFETFKNIENFDAEAMKSEVFLKLELFVTNITSSLPEVLVNVVKSLFSGLGTLVISLIIGFYLLLDFDKNAEMMYSLIPKRQREEVKNILDTINVPLKKFVNGALIDCSVIFIITAIGFTIIGLKSPLLFALFCAITNIIPYAGPYIGGFPAVLVGFTQSPTVGIIILIFIVVIQGLEGNLLQPYIMSKTTKLNPVTIILGLLIFGHFFGIVGMVISTPIIGALKALLNFYDEKYNLLNFEDNK